MMVKATRKMISLFLTAAICAGVGRGAVNAQEAALLSVSDLKNPVIEIDASMDAGQKVTWDCVWFGSYPQAEIVSSLEKYTALDKGIIKDGDVIENSSLFDKLQNATEWDDNNDIEIEGNKYRRLRRGDIPPASGSSSGSCYYNWPDEETYHYFQYEPIKWRILKVNGKEAFLLADLTLDNKNYNTQNKDITWETSTIRSWLNGYGKSFNDAKIDYSEKNFINSAFLPDESSAIADTTVINEDNKAKGTSGGNDTTDKIFFLSEAETYGESAKVHGFASPINSQDEARRNKSSIFAKAMGRYFMDRDRWKGNVMWWLRSPGKSSSYAVYGNYLGNIPPDGISVYNMYAGVRPALYLDLSSNLHSYAGTVCSDGTEDEVNPGGDQTEPGEEDIPVTDISLSESKLQLKVGEKKQITVSVLPGNATEKGVLWSSSDKSVAEIDTEGIVTAKASGKCTVQCTAVGNSEISKSAEIEVLAEQAGGQEPGDNPGTNPGADNGTGTKPGTNPGTDADTNPGSNTGGNTNTDAGDGTNTNAGTNKNIKVSKIELSGISKKIAAGKKIRLTASVTPSNVSDKSVTWTSSNKKVATVNSSGVVTMKKNSGGKSVTITAAAKDGGGVKATYKIKSMRGVVKKVTISGKKSVKAGKTLKLKAKVKATKNANKKLKWTSSNKKYATVSSSGKVKALKAGKGKKVKITAMATDGSGKKKTVVIKIK